MDHIDERIQHQRELAERRKAWEAERKAEAEERVRQEKRSRMEAWLANRRQAWLDHTGSPPTSDLLRGWQTEYVNEVAAEQELERAFRLAQAEDNAVI